MATIEEKSRAIIAALTSGEFDESEYNIDELLEVQRHLEEQVDPTSLKGSEGKYAVVWLSNLKREYERTLQMVGISSFLYCQLREYTVKAREKIQDHGLTEANFKTAVQLFLDDHFKYNGDIHVGEMRKRNPTTAQKKRFQKLVAAERLREATAEKEAALARSTAETARRAELDALLADFAKGAITADALKDAIVSAEAAAKASLEECSRAQARLEQLNDIVASEAIEATLDDPSDNFGAVEIEAAAETAEDAPTHEQTEESIAAAMDAAASKDVTAPPEETPLEKVSRELLLSAIPKDFAYYYSVYFNDNYNSLRQVVETVFDVKSFLEEAMIVHDPLFDSTEEASEYVMSQASDKLALNIVKTNNPVFTGPFQKNLDATEFSGAGWAAFKAVMDYQRTQTKDAEAMLANIKKVRSARDKYSVPADSKDVAAYAAFAEGLREEAATRALTEAEQELVDAEEPSEDKRKDLYQKIGTERSAKLLKEAEADLDLPEHADEVVSQMFVSDPDTGKMTSKIAFMPTDDAQEKEIAAARHTGAKVVNADGTAAKKVAGVRKVPKKSPKKTTK